MDELLALPETPMSLEDIAALILVVDSPPSTAPFECSPLLDADWSPSLQNDHLGTATDVVEGAGAPSAGSFDAPLPPPGVNDNEAGGVKPACSADAIVDASEEEQTATSSRDGALVSRQRAYREKKATLRELRALAATLADQLATMQSRGTKADSMVAGWRGVALRQLKRWQQAKALNRELRTQIRQHHGLALQLIDALRLRMAALPSKRTLELLSPQQQKPVMVFDDTDRCLIDIFRRELVDMYARADGILRNTKMPELGPGVDHSIRHARRRDYATGLEYVEVAESQVVPFALADAVYAMHKAIPILCGSECKPAFLSFPGSAYEFAVKLQYGSTVNAAVQYESILVSKAVEEKGRWLLVWRNLSRESTVTTTHSPSFSLIGASFLDEGWGTVREFPSSLDGQSPGTIFEFYTRTRLYHSSSAIPASARLDEYMQEVVRSAANEAANFSQVMENVLVDEMAALSVSRGRSKRLVAPH